jgi:plasmid stability protein
MAQINISLPDDLLQTLRQRAAADELSVEDFVRHVLSREVEFGDQIAALLKMANKPDYFDDHPEELERLIQEGLDTGPATPWTHEDFEESKRRLIERFGKRSESA